MMVQRGSVIRLNKESRWPGAFAIVGLVASWGVKASMPMPEYGGKRVGYVPMRLTPKEFDDFGFVLKAIPVEVDDVEETTSLDSSRSSFGHKEDHP